MSWRDKIAAVLAGKVGGPTPSGIHVYHSSPHDFDRFDLSKIGTGEGAQVYGHGIYAAENPAVSGQGGQYWKQFLPRFEGAERFAADRLKGNNYDRDAALKIATDEATYWRDLLPTLSPDDKGRDYVARMAANQQKALELLQSGAPVGPRTYEVNFKAKPEELLDWDKRLSQQSEHVRAAIPEIVKMDEVYRQRYPHSPMADPFGSNIYSRMQATGGLGIPDAKAQAAAALRERGIPGIRYLDEGSRNLYGPAQGMIDNYGSREAALAKAQRFLEGGHGDPAHYGQMVELLQKKPTHNYVAFDPSKLDIMAKYGVVGATGGVLGAGAMGGTIDQSTYGARQ